jgi:hypothetical protein
MRAYINGAQVGTTQTSLGTWSGALDSAQTCIGAANTTPASVHSGWLAHPAIWNVALTPAEVAWLSQVQP